MPFRSPLPDVDIPDISITELMFGNLGDRVDRPALVDGVSGQSITYGQLSVLVNQVAGALAGRGIGKGDRVAIFAPNTPLSVEPRRKTSSRWLSRSNAP